MDITVIPAAGPAMAGQRSLSAQYVTFKVNRIMFGIEVESVQEIIRTQPMTPVPLAPSIVRGLVNLRGQIITAIDMRSLLKLAELPPDSDPMNVVVRANGEIISLLVDTIGDVITVDRSTYECTPETVTGSVARILSGVFKLENQLMLILDISACTEMTEL